jgi:hypothetical protein
LLQVDEYNLLYVAATRSKVALVVNPDLEQLLLSGSHKPVLLQARAAVALMDVNLVPACSAAFTCPTGTSNTAADETVYTHINIVICQQRAHCMCLPAVQVLEL